MILLNGATEIVPDTLGRQLKPDGRLVGVFGRSPAAKAMICHLIEGHMVGRPIFDAAASAAAGLCRAGHEFVFIHARLYLGCHCSMAGEVFPRAHDLWRICAIVQKFAFSSGRGFTPQIRAG